MDDVQYAATRQRISALMQGWMYRDLGQWERLRDLFHPEAQIEVSWFQGPASEFLERSQEMARSSFRTKHLMGDPILEIEGDRAYTETNIVVISENEEIGLGATSHARFMDRVERRDGVWRIARRDVGYDMAAFTFPFGLTEIDRAEVKKFPREYGALGYVLERSGYSIDRPMATRGSDAERVLRQNSLAWLHATS